MRYPYLAPWFKLRRNGDRLLLHNGETVAVLEGQAVKALLTSLLPLLDGTRSVDDLVEAFGEQNRTAVFKVLSTLEEAELLTEGPPAPRDQSTFRKDSAEFVASLWPHSLSIAQAVGNLEVASVGILGSSDVASQLVRLLRISGIGRGDRFDWEMQAPQMRELDLAIAAPSGDELDRLGTWNRSALDTDLPWLQTLPFYGTSVIIGPLFVPGTSSCHWCFRLRRAANVAYPTDFEELFTSSASPQSVPALDATSVGTAATVVLRWISFRDLRSCTWWRLEESADHVPL